MSKNFTKADVKFKSVYGDKQAHTINMGNVIENADEADIKEVRDALDTLVEHPITETKLTQTYTIN